MVFIQMNFKLLSLLILLKFADSNKRNVCRESEFDEDRIFFSYLPSGFGGKSVKILNSFTDSSIDSCVKECCISRKCDAIIFNSTQCDLVHCARVSQCKPVATNIKEKYLYYIVLSASYKVKESEKEEMDKGLSTCEVNIPESCPANQICEPLTGYRKAGICICNIGYTKQGDECVKKINPDISNGSKSESLVTQKIPLPNSSEVAPAIKPPPVNRRTTTKKAIISTTKKLTTKKLTTKKLTTKKKPTNDEGKHSNNLQFSANAGPDITLKVLKSSLFDRPEMVPIYGSVRIKKKIFDAENFIYSWRRLPDSLAAGTIVNNSNHEPTLWLTNMLQGQYLFELTVTSLDGNQSQDVMTLDIIETTDDISLNLVDIILMTNVYQFHEKDKEAFSKRMAHIIEKDFLYSETAVGIQSIGPHYNNNTRITFYAKMYNRPLKTYQLISSGLLERQLKNKIIKHQFIFDYPVEMFGSRICYDDCGGHGICDQISHRCQCSFPWFNNLFHEYKTGFSNCDMHAMIVMVTCAVGLFFCVLLIIVIRKIVRKIQLRRKYGKKKIQYTVLENTET